MNTNKRASHKAFAFSSFMKEITYFLVLTNHLSKYPWRSHQPILFELITNSQVTNLPLARGLSSGYYWIRNLYVILLLDQENLTKAIDVAPHSPCCPQSQHPGHLILIKRLETSLSLSRLTVTFNSLPCFHYYIILSLVKTKAKIGKFSEYSLRSYLFGNSV